MADITAKMVNDLRQKTGLSMMLVKKALVEAGGDEAKAVEILKQQVGKVLMNRAENATEEGKIFTALKADGSEAAAVELQCESPPVASAEDFIALGTNLVNQLLNGPGASTPEELLAQPSPKGGTLKDQFDDCVNKIREKFVVARIARVKGPVGVYVHHDGKTAVLLEATGENLTAPVLRDVAMHVAAMKPTVATTDQVDPALVKAERDKLVAEATKSGKPANIIEKIVDGKLSVFYRDEAGVLTEQAFAKDDSKSVRQVLAEAGLKVKNYTLWILGRK
jgi:elongation factor Ts